MIILYSFFCSSFIKLASKLAFTTFSFFFLFLEYTANTSALLSSSFSLPSKYLTVSTLSEKIMSFCSLLNSISCPSFLIFFCINSVSSNFLNKSNFGSTSTPDHIVFNSSSFCLSSQSASQKRASKSPCPYTLSSSHLSLFIKSSIILSMSCPLSIISCRLSIILIISFFSRLFGITIQFLFQKSIIATVALYNLSKDFLKASKLLSSRLTI